MSDRRRTGLLSPVLVLAVGAGLLLVGCRPDSVTGARDGLSRGGARTVSYRLPLAREAYGALSFLRNTTTVELADRLVAVPVRPDTIRAPIGAELLADGRVDLEAVEPMDAGSLDLDELAASVAASEVRTAPVEVTVRHTSAAPWTLLDPTLALVRTDGDGVPARDASGDLDLESDASGDPLTVPLADTLPVPPGDSVRLERDGAGLVDRMVELLVAGEPVAVVLTGAVEVAAADRARVDPDDLLILGHRALVALDLVLPDSGVVVSRREVGDGLGFSSPDADQIEDRVLRAGGRVAVSNEIPFRVRLDVAYVSGERPRQDVFAARDRVVLDSLDVAGGGPGGVSAVDTVEVSLTGSELRPLLEDAFTAGIRIRLLPRRGSGGRGALRVDDLVDVDARVFADVRAGDGS